MRKSNWIIYPSSGENNKYLKPPPSFRLIVLILKFPFLEPLVMDSLDIVLIILFGLSQKNYANQIAQNSCRHVGLERMSSVSVECDPSITRSWWSLEMMKRDNQAIASKYIHVWCMSNKTQ